MENNDILTPCRGEWCSPCSRPLKIIYIHGFMSSGNATKSQILRTVLEKNYPDIAYYSPTLIHHPLKAMQQLQIELDQQKDRYQFCFVGSSLGGFYSIYLAHRYPDSKAILINPTTNPWETMHHYCGDYDNEATGEKFSVTPEFVASLEAFKCEKILDPKRFLLLVQTDDDVVDCQRAQKVFAGSLQIVRTGGGHQFNDFSEVLPEVLNFITE